MPEEHPGSPDDDLEKPPPFFPYEPEDEQETPVSYGEPVEVTVDGVYATESEGNIHRFVVLTDGERTLQIVIGPFESYAISLPLQGQQPDRPLTHDLIKTIMERTDATLEKVVIDDLWSTTFYAKLFITHGDEEMVIDSRPSDAIALAVRMSAPIYVADGILDQTQP